MDDLEINYIKHKRKLREDTENHSFPHSWLEHESYKSIVSMGMPVVSFIIDDLQKSIDTNKCEDYHGWWTLNALPEITGVNIPVNFTIIKLEDGFVKVSVDDVSKLWINWAKENGKI